MHLSSGQPRSDDAGGARLCRVPRDRLRRDVRQDGPERRGGIPDGHAAGKIFNIKCWH